MGAPAQPDSCSDYSDFGDDEEELEIIDQLLGKVTSSIPLVVTDIEDYESPRGLYLPKKLEYEVLSKQSDADTETDQKLAEVHSLKQENIQVPAEINGQSPLERFRKPPKKALSVTDLVSPAWCELQYFYTLSKHGKKRRTPAMRQGTAIHQALEDEVHSTIPVEVTKVEDSWGLRIWNIIQGLRTLRDTGRTRELEVWGTVGGELVNGVIDELSYTCPDPKYEENLQPKKTIEAELPEYQTSITDYLLSKGRNTDGEKSIGEALKPVEQQSQKWIYITDVKTRATPTLPSGSSVRPTILQLHLYHHMLENMAQGNFHLSILTERYNLNPNETFSDSFLAQLGTINQSYFRISSSQDDSEANISQEGSSQDSLDIVLQHNTLSTLWEYMISEFQTTFLTSPPIQKGIDEEVPTPTPQSVSEIPPPPSQPTRLSTLLTAEYLAPTYKHVPGTAKTPIGRKSFGFNAAFLKAYLEDGLAWWRGEREARGVELQEAWKCRSCDYRDDCAWIHDRDAAAVKDAMERKAMREVAGVEDEGGKKKTKRSRSKV